ncbi:G2/M phase-specific E3 ubiquitin-protein ligase-like [Glandiceps talaboti]
MSRGSSSKSTTKHGGKVKSSVPYIPGKMDILEVTDDTVSIMWKAAVGNVDNYRISHFGPGELEVDDCYLEPGKEMYTIKGLQANVEYTVTVTPYCWDSGGAGTPITTVCVPGIPSASSTIDSARNDVESTAHERAALKEYIKRKIKPNRGERFDIKVDRKIPMMYHCCIQQSYYTDKNADKLRFCPEVEFVDSTNTCDLGGPMREYFTLLMQHIMIGYYAEPDEDNDPDVDPIFEGEDDHKVPTHDDVLLVKKIYMMVGRMVQHSIIWGGPGLAGLAQSVKDYVTTGSIEEVNLDISDVPDYEIRENIQSIMDSNGDHLKKLGQTPEIITMLADAGFVNRLVNDKSKHYCIQQLLLHNIIKRRQEELDQFRTGFNSLSLAEVLGRSNDIVRIVFPKQADTVVSLCELSPLIHFDDLDTTDKGKTAEFFTTYLQECDRRKIAAGTDDKSVVSLGKLLQFITGCPTMPPKSYDKIQVTFHSQRLPIAETCFQEVCIPTIYKTYKEFRDRMDEAILNCAGFGML